MNVRNDVIALMQDLYYETLAARTALIVIGYPLGRIPAFNLPSSFWTEAVLALESGIIEDGMVKLLVSAAEEYPGNARVADLLTHVRGVTGPGTVLCLFTDPLRTSKMRIDREARLLKEIEDRGGVIVRTRHAVRVSDVLTAIIQEKPQIIHFAGHGQDNGQLMFEDDRGGAKLVGAKVLAEAIAAGATAALDCVVLNSCFTGSNAEDFRGVTKAVAGSVTAVRDECALAFARGFYTAIAAGRTPERAFEAGRAEMGLRGCDTSGLEFVSFEPART